MKALDLFCRAGGASMGLHRAGFEVTGVDLHRQPRYPFRFIQGDALEVDLAGFDFIWASPPCQRFSRATKWRGHPTAHPDLVDAVRRQLRETSSFWVMENVPESPLRRDLVLCGSHFGLAVRRHRVFELSHPVLALLPQCRHSPDDLPFMHKNERAFANAMGCTWMSNKDARQAIPPAYSEFIAREFLAGLRRAA